MLNQPKGRINHDSYAVRSVREIPLFVSMSKPLPNDHALLLILNSKAERFVEWASQFVAAYDRLRNVLLLRQEGRIEVLPDQQMAAVIVTRYLEVVSRSPPSIDSAIIDYILTNEECRIAIVGYVTLKQPTSEGTIDLNVPMDVNSVARLDLFASNIAIIEEYLHGLLGSIREKLELLDNLNVEKTPVQVTSNSEAVGEGVSDESLRQRNLPVIKIDHVKLIAFVNGEPFVLKTEEVATFLQAIVDASKRYPAIISFPEMKRLHPILAVGNPTRYFKLLHAKIKVHIDRSNKGYWLILLYQTASET